MYLDYRNYKFLICCFAIIFCMYCVIWCWLVSCAAVMWQNYWTLEMYMCECKYICMYITGAFPVLNGSSNLSQNHANPLVTVASQEGTCMQQYLIIVSGLKQSWPKTQTKILLNAYTMASNCVLALNCCGVLMLTPTW